MVWSAISPGISVTPAQYCTPHPGPIQHVTATHAKRKVRLDSKVQLRRSCFFTPGSEVRIPLLLRSRAKSGCSCFVIIGCADKTVTRAEHCAAVPSVTLRGNICGTCQNFANQSALKQIGRLWKVGGQRSAVSWLNMQLQASSYLPKSQDGHKNANYLIERRESDWFISIRSANLVGKGLDFISF